MHIAQFRLEFLPPDPTIVRAGMACCRSGMSAETAMRAPSLLVAGLAAAIVSIAPANAQNVQSAQDGKKLQTLSEPNMGWTDWEGWYGCNAPWAQKLTHGR
jgi:hypothetical protein